MKFHDLKPSEGAKHRKKRVGRGTGSGHGKTSTKGHKGQGARSGGVKPPGFEGGQTPLILRVPKRGFTPIDRVETLTINIDRIEKFEFPENRIDVNSLMSLGVIDPPRSRKFSVKILGTGDPTKPYIVEGIRVSKSVQEKIIKIGGSIG